MTTYDEGGLTQTPGGFVSEIRSVTSDYLEIFPQAEVFKGEDDVSYYISSPDSGNAGFHDFDIRLASDGTVALTLAGTTVRADLIADGVIPPGGWLGSGMLTQIAFNVPETPYVIIFVSTSGGISVDHGVAYYKLNAASALEYVGGFSADTSGTGVQFSPSAGDQCGLGFLPQFATEGANNTIPYKFPMIVTYRGESRSTSFVIPSINQIISSSPINEASTNWQDMELNFSDAGLDESSLLTQNCPQTSSNQCRTFVLPRASGGAYLAVMWFTSDVEAYDAGTETVANTFLSTNAPTYPTGFISTIGVSVSASGAALGFTASFGSATVSINNKIKTFAGAAAFPFPDDKKQFDGTAATAANAFYGNPSVYPSDLSDHTAPWFVFFPKMDRVTRDSIGVRVFQWDPVEETLTFLDFAYGEVFELGVDVNAATSVFSTAISWNRSTGALSLLMRSIDGAGHGFIVSDFGTFSPVAFAADSGGVSETFRLRAWYFTMDGHSFYVLRLGQVGTFIFDRTTRQWSQWKTGTDEVWDAVNGTNWNGKIVAGSVTGPYLLEVDPDQAHDNVDVSSLEASIESMVTAFFSVRGRGRAGVSAVRLTASLGEPDQVGATISLRYSDDNGKTWSTQKTITIISGDYDQDLSWRSIGSMRAPGRIFEITDSGGVKRIDDAVIE